MTNHTEAAPDLRELSDNALVSTTSLYRNLADKGISGAQGCMRLHQDEMTRRFGGHTTVAATLDKPPAGPTHWWRFW